MENGCVIVVRKGSVFWQTTRLFVCVFFLFQFRAAGGGYLIDSWDSEKGLPDNFVTSIVQAGVADYALSLPEGSERTLALTAALHTWSEGDVAEAATWLTQFGSSPELDRSVAEIATESRNLEQPSVAVTWAESITNPQLCSRTLVAVLEAWASLDATAARDYATSSPFLQAQDRTDVLVNIAQVAGKD